MNQMSHQLQMIRDLQGKRNHYAKLRSHFVLVVNANLKNRSAIDTSLNRSSVLGTVDTAHLKELENNVSLFKETRNQLHSLESNFAALKIRHESLEQRHAHTDKHIESLLKLPSQVDSYRKEIGNLSQKLHMDLRHEVETVARRIELLEEKDLDSAGNSRLDIGLPFGGEKNCNLSPHVVSGAPLAQDSANSQDDTKINIGIAEQLAKLEVDLEMKILKNRKEVETLLEQKLESIEDNAGEVERQNREVLSLRKSMVEVESTMTKLPIINVSLQKHTGQIQELFEWKGYEENQKSSKLEDLRFEMVDKINQFRAEITHETETKRRETQDHIKAQLDSLIASQETFEKDLNEVSYQVENANNELQKRVGPKGSLDDRVDNLHAHCRNLDDTIARQGSKYAILPDKIDVLERMVSDLVDSNSKAICDEAESLLSRNKVQLDEIVAELNRKCEDVLQRTKDDSMSTIVAKLEDMDKANQVNLTDCFQQLKDQTDSYSSQVMEKALQEIRGLMKEQVTVFTQQAEEKISMLNLEGNDCKEKKYVSADELETRLEALETIQDVLPEYNPTDERRNPRLTSDPLDQS